MQPPPPPSPPVNYYSCCDNNGLGSSMSSVETASTTPMSRSSSSFSNGDNENYSSNSGDDETPDASPATDDDYNHLNVNGTASSYCDVEYGSMKPSGYWPHNQQQAQPQPQPQPQYSPDISYQTENFSSSNHTTGMNWASAESRIMRLLEAQEPICCSTDGAIYRPARPQPTQINVPFLVDSSYNLTYGPQRLPTVFEEDNEEDEEYDDLCKNKEDGEEEDDAEFQDTQEHGDDRLPPFYRPIPSNCFIYGYQDEDMAHSSPFLPQTLEVHVLDDTILSGFSSSAVGTASSCKLVKPQALRVVCPTTIAPVIRQEYEFGSPDICYGCGDDHDADDEHYCGEQEKEEGSDRNNEEYPWYRSYLVESSQHTSELQSDQQEQVL